VSKPIKKDIRVIVPCFNSDLTIEKCISSIFSSKDIEYELFIVDDGNNNKLDSIHNNFPVKIIRTEGQEGAGRARNIGTYGFNGKIVVFIDSDVQIYPDTLASLIKPIKENLTEASVGSYSKVPGRNFYATYKHFYLAHRYNPQQRYLSNTLWSAICAIDYNVYTKLNGFKECFSGAGPEDIDFGMELSKYGARILSVPEARGIHLSTYSFVKLLTNDLRKGSEDIYIHWTRKVPLRYNRHVDKTEIVAVIFACTIPLLILFQFYIGFGPLLLGISVYFLLRIRFLLKTFEGEDIKFIIRSFLLTYILDLTRVSSVIRGTLFFIIEKLSWGKYKPFARSVI
jgi:glycosyltransferase involved in cell wall biosynthesis